MLAGLKTQRNQNKMSHGGTQEGGMSTNEKSMFVLWSLLLHVQCESKCITVQQNMDFEV